MKHYKAYSIYLIVFISMNSISTTTQAKGLFDIISDFFDGFAQNVQPQYNTTYTLSHKQAQNYIDLYVVSLDNGLHPNASYNDIQNIRNKTNTAFNQSSTVFIWISGIRMYNKDMIDQFLLSAIIETVESNTYNYAFDQTRSTHTASKITQTIRTKLMKLIERKQVLDPQDLRPFFGYPLQQAIRTEIAHVSYQYNNTGHSYHYPSYGSSGNIGSSGHHGYSGATYASRACCICFDTFGGATERLFLKPCGHDICTMCALDYFFPNNLPDQTKKCPICRSWVNLEELYNDVL